MFSPDDLLARIEQHVDHPATLRELAKRLQVPPEFQSQFKRQIRTLVQEGRLVETRGRHYGLPRRMDLAVGRLSMHPNGYGFVRPEEPVDKIAGDLYIAGHNLTDAFHGDRVVVRVEHVRADGRAEGSIVRVLERGAQWVVGRFETDRAGMSWIVPFDKRLQVDIQVTPGDRGQATAGEMVVADITQWPTPGRGPRGRVTEVLGHIDAPGVDTRIIIAKHGLPDRHTEQAITEARRLGRVVKPRDLEGRTDFRPLPTVTIDGEHARDFDDAITIDRLANGHFWLGVHIADVSHYVRPGSRLDEEAADRGTSVYFPERALHMFPAELATGLCSLNPAEDRLVQSVLMEIDRNGRVVRYELHDGVIHSSARMTYTAVNAILTDGDPALRERYAALVPHFELMRALFEVLNRRRRDRGSIDFDLPEPEVVLDAEGLIEQIIVAERNVAHRLIEEFMLLANETVARHLVDHALPSLYRVHEAPDPLKVAEFDAFVGALGYGLAPTGSSVEPRDFQRLVEKIQGRPEERAVAMIMLRTMQKARYDPANLGHFGLATRHYLHFTSPIRRYPDLIVHRMLRALRHGEAASPWFEDLVDELPQLARHTSEMERRADDAERELVQWKKVRFMADKVGDEFDGFVTGVAPFGLFIELVEHFVEGLVHVSTMADDYYHYSERAHTLHGDKTRRTYRLGDRVRVQVLRADLERRQVELGLSEVLDAVRRGVRGERTGRLTGRSASPGRRAGRPGRRERQLGRAAARAGRKKR